MKRILGVLVVALLLGWSVPAPAQMFGKRTKPNPSQRVPELILIVKTEGNERKRVHAAEELRDFDATVFTEIVPVLADVAQHDKNQNVRYEAITSLMKIRPINAIAGQALERAATRDEAWRIRLHAKTALTRYYLAGYSAKKTEALPTAQRGTSEPPLAVEAAPPAQRREQPVTGGAPPAPRPLPIRQPLPKGPSAEPPPALPMIPAPPAAGQGPSLFP